MPNNIDTESAAPITTDIPQRDLRQYIDQVRARLKRHPLVIDLFKEFDVPIDEIDLIPMCFAKIGVSARTDHGVIYFNLDLVGDGDFEGDDHYMVHEMTHFLQQTTGNQATQGAADGDYLENEDEVEGFQHQIDYMADTRDEETANNYADKLLDHHDVHDKKKRQERKEKLLALVNS